MISVAESIREMLASAPPALFRGLKIETEGEGAPWSRIYNHAVIAAQLNLPMTLKIGGPDARTDLRRAKEVGIGGVTAPLVESKFAVRKFRDALGATFGESPPVQMNILLESSQGIANYREIVDAGVGLVTGANFGRSDLRLSLRMDRADTPDVDSSDFLDFISRPAAYCKSQGYLVTVGGQITSKSIPPILKSRSKNSIDCVETRRFVLDFPTVAQQPELINLALEVEEVMVRAEVSSEILKNSGEASRLAALRKRLANQHDG